MRLLSNLRDVFLLVNVHPDVEALSSSTAISSFQDGSTAQLRAV